MEIVNDRPLMQTNEDCEKCPVCGSVEIPSNSPLTTYSCGSSDYDRRPKTFKQGEQCVELCGEVEVNKIYEEVITFSDASVDTNSKSDSCYSCDEEYDEKCTNSTKPCGHHSNSSWTHDECSFCGKEWGVDDGH